ncbi:hypothetical protein ABFS82_06G184300 [Erythranthe guttata]
MINAIETVFPDSHHRLCQWHIYQNAPSHFGSLNNNSEFKNMFHRCMEFCESEEEFDDIWTKMIAGFNLYDHSWLNNMYKLRSKWSTAFSKHRFSAGLKATSRSEGTNSTLKMGGKRTHTLYDCVVRFENVQNTWRQDEKENDFRNRHGAPTLAVKSNCLLKEAAAVYTHTIYYMFQSELINSLGIYFDGDPIQSDTLIKFKVSSQGNSNCVQEVEFDSRSHGIKCTCRLFESLGILCKHALLVFKQMNVHTIPIRYIKVRWTKNIRDRVHFSEENSRVDNNESETVYVNHAMRLCYDLMMRSKVHQEARNLVRTGLEGVFSDLNDLLDRLSLDKSVIDDTVLQCSNVREFDMVKANNVINDEHVRNPLYVKSRGVNNVRLPSHWDSKSKKGKGKLESTRTVTKGKHKKVQPSRLTVNIPLPEKDISNGLSSGGYHADCFYHMTNPTIHVGQGSDFCLSQPSPSMFKYFGSNLSQESATSMEKPPNHS